MNYNNYQTDKVRNHTYMPQYERLFEKFKQGKVSLLEIGVYSGGCLAMWRDFFGEGSDIEGLDFNCASLDRENLGDILVHDVDVLDWDTDKTYDIIIDDASHEAHVQNVALRKLWKNVSKRGYYIIEDVNSTVQRPPHLGLLEWAEENDAIVEVYNGRDVDDCLWIITHKSQQKEIFKNLTIWQKIASIFKPRKNKGE